MLPLRFDFIFKLTAFHVRQKKLLKIVHGFTDDVILTRRARLTASDDYGSDEIDLKQKPALIDILLRATIDGSSLTDMDIREEVDTFMFAGHDTTASGIAFCLYNISKYSEVQQKAFEEIRKVIGDDTRKEITLKDLNELHYLELVIKETLRLFPAVPFIGRKITEDTVISTKTKLN